MSCIGKDKGAGEPKKSSSMKHTSHSKDQGQLPQSKEPAPYSFAAKPLLEVLSTKQLHNVLTKLWSYLYAPEKANLRLVCTAFDALARSALITSTRVTLTETVAKLPNNLAPPESVVLARRFQALQHLYIHGNAVSLAQLPGRLENWLAWHCLQPHPTVSHITLSGWPDAASITSERLAALGKSFPNLHKLSIYIESKSQQIFDKGKLLVADFFLALPRLRALKFVGVAYGSGVNSDVTLRSLMRLPNLTSLELLESFCEDPPTAFEALASAPQSLTRLNVAFLADHMTDLTEQHASVALHQLKNLSSLSLQVKISESEDSLCPVLYTPRMLPQDPTWGARLREVRMPLVLLEPSDVRSLASIAPGITRLAVARLTPGSAEALREKFPRLEGLGLSAPISIQGVAMREVLALLLSGHIAGVLAPSGSARQLAPPQQHPSNANTALAAAAAQATPPRVSNSGAIAGRPSSSGTIMTTASEKYLADALTTSPMKLPAVGSSVYTLLNLRMYVIADHATADAAERLGAALCRVQSVALSVGCRNDKDWTRMLGVLGRVPTLEEFECTPAGNIMTQHGASSGAMVHAKSSQGLGSCMSACKGSSAAARVKHSSASGRAPGTPNVPSLGNAHVRHMARNMGTIKVLRIGMNGSQLTGTGMTVLKELPRLQRLELCGCRCGVQRSVKFSEDGAAPRSPETGPAGPGFSASERLGIDGLMTLAEGMRSSGARIIYYASGWNELQAADLNKRAKEAGLGFSVAVDRTANKCWCTVDAQRTSGRFWGLI